MTIWYLYFYHSLYTHTHTHIKLMSTSCGLNDRILKSLIIIITDFDSYCLRYLKLLLLCHKWVKLSKYLYHIYVSLPLTIYVYVRTHTHTNIHTQTHEHTYTHTHTHTYIYIYIYREREREIHVWLGMCVYVCIKWNEVIKRNNIHL